MQLLIIIHLFFVCLVISASDTSEVISIFPSLSTANVKHSGNVICDRDFNEYRSNLENFTLWAYEIQDATAKSTTGVLRGSIYNMGDFGQCLTARAPFATQYCLVGITANIPKLKTKRDPFSLYYSPNDHLLSKLYRFNDLTKQSRNVVRMGWCLPNSCSPKQAETSLNRHFQLLNHSLTQENVTYTADIPAILCQSSSQDNSLDHYDILFCIITGSLMLLVVLSTIWDINYADTSKKTTFRNVIMAFSARQNFLNLANSEGSEKSLQILYGIKTYSIFMIMIDHRFGTFIGGPVLNFNYIEESYRNIAASYIFHGDLFVDSFFVISGLLVTNSLLKVFEKKFVNPGFIIMMRYMRLTPVYAFAVFFCATIAYHTGNGPLWQMVMGLERNDCRQNWWLSMLYISNYVNTDHACLVSSWYLPCDLHYFIIALCLMLIYRKSRKTAISLFIFLTILSVLIQFGLIFMYEKQAFLRFLPDFLENPKPHEDMVMLYSKSHFRATPYFMGMIAGYISYRLKENMVLSKCYSNLIFIISLFLLGISLFAGAIFYDPYHPYNPWEHAFYGSLHRPIWALGTIGFMFSVGYGGEQGLIYQCLSWKVWIPLSKLVFGAYLLHFPMQMRTMAKSNGPSVSGYFDIITLSFSDIVLGFMMALVMHLIVEAPTKKLFRILLTPKKSVTENISTKQNGERK